MSQPPGYARCDECGQPFTQTNKVSKYCSVKCRKRVSNRQEWRKKKAQQEDGPRPGYGFCRYCRSEFPRKTKKQQFCSELCKKREKLPQRRRPQQFELCLYCGQSFQMTRKDQIYCSYDCRKGDHDEILAEKENRRDKPGNRKCATCGRPTSNYRCEECWRKIRGEPDTLEAIDFGTELAL